jgi:hypothetical protein
MKPSEIGWLISSNTPIALRRTIGIPSLLIGSEIADPISGSLPHGSYLCQVRPAE